MSSEIVTKAKNNLKGIYRLVVAGPGGMWAGGLEETGCPSSWGQDAVLSQEAVDCWGHKAPKGDFVPGYPSDSGSYGISPGDELAEKKSPPMA